MEVVESGRKQGVWVQCVDRRKQPPAPPTREHFSVFDRDKLEICEGERIRITANAKDAEGRRLDNGSFMR